MNRSHIICHMTMSIDGKVTGDFLFRPECESAAEIYYQINCDYHADAFACGRVTIEESFTHGYQSDLSGFADAVIQREDYIADKNVCFLQSLLTVTAGLDGKLQKLQMMIPDMIMPISLRCCAKIHPTLILHI